jgi:hypothetical protein
MRTLALLSLEPPRIYASEQDLPCCLAIGTDVAPYRCRPMHSGMIEEESGDSGSRGPEQDLWKQRRFPSLS